MSPDPEEPRSYPRRQRVYVCLRAELQPRAVKVVSLDANARARRVYREALVLLDEQGVVRAYLNRCEHLPVPLDGGTRDFFSDDGHLRCGTHGALYRLNDGLCVLGPCLGASLQPLEVTTDHGSVYLVDVGEDERS